jgi:hypothetical protein
VRVCGGRGVFPQFAQYVGHLESVGIEFPLIFQFYIYSGSHVIGRGIPG